MVRSKKTSSIGTLAVLAFIIVVAVSVLYSGTPSAGKATSGGGAGASPSSAVDRTDFETKSNYFTRVADSAVTPAVSFDYSVRLNNAHLFITTNDFCTCN